MIPLSVPHIVGNEWKYVKDCLDTGWVSTAGAYVGRFEEAIGRYTGSPHAIACMNGTAALHTCLNILEVGPGDLVIAPNLTFVATVNAIRYTGASAVLIDIDPGTWQMDLSLLEEYLASYTGDRSRIKACMPVHVLGNIGDMDRLLALCNKYGMPLVEDSTEALGSTYRGKHAGTFGLFGTSSFNGNKIITTGGGGMVFTADASLGARARHLTTTAKTDPLDYFHDELGYNYRLVNVLAAVGVAQIERLPEVLERKKEIDRFYRNELAGIADISFQKVLPYVEPNCWLFTFRTQQMRSLLTYLNANGVQSRPFWTPMNRLPMYDQCTYVTHHDHAAEVHRSAISIPSSSSITNEELREVVECIKRFYNN